MKAIVFFVLLTAIGLGQYSKNDKDLVKTTFLRQFDKNLLTSYFTSAKPEQVRAALLSVSHSADTAWVTSITNVDFTQHSTYVTFALGQLGQSHGATEYLLAKLAAVTDAGSRRLIAEALGKTAPAANAATIAATWKQNGNYPAGTPLFLLNAWLRGNKDSLLPAMTAEMLADSGRNQRDAVFALYRMGGYAPAARELFRLLEEAVALQDPFIAQYTLGCLRRMKVFPENPALLQRVLTHKNWVVRNEAAKSAVYFPFYKQGNSSLAAAYTALLKDANSSVARQAAQSLADAALPSPNAGVLGAEAFRYLSARGLSANTLGELAVSLSLLMPKETAQWLSKNSKKAGVAFAARAVAKQPALYAGTVQIFKGLYAQGTEKEKIDVIEAFFSVPAAYRAQPATEELLIECLKAELPGVSGTIGENADSTWFPTKKQDAISAITFTILKNLNNADFIEVLASLLKLLTGLDSFHADGIKMIMQGSELSAVRKMAGAPGEGGNAKSAELFERLWKSAFSYRSVKVVTNKGSFTIKLQPELAPVTCGSFSALSAGKFYLNNSFHRVVPGFVIQTGDRTQTGWGGPGYAITSECSPAPFTKGTAGIASAGKDTEGSQWFIMNAEHPHLNGRYTVFGTVTAGQDVADAIDQGDMITGIQLIK